MYQINDYIMYKREVCKIVGIKEKYYQNHDYYELVPISDDTLTTHVPIDSNFIKSLMTKEEVNALIEKIPNIPIIKTETRLIENEYKNLLSSGSYEDLIKIIKTTYLRNQDRIEHHKRAGDKDNYYFTKAENFLYNEIAVVLNLSFEQAKEYVVKKVENLQK